ncbi:DNA polymerase II large subunit [Candidatus Micrarchaeota archaeon]|nr:DNA polymerase II large subunit [Candidatus Micrarchaeota archaeon]
MSYQSDLKKGFAQCFEIARQARKKGVDPLKNVEITHAEDVASRVEGLVGPQGIAEKVSHLVKSGRDRESIIVEISDEILQGKWPLRSSSATDEREARIEQAVRTGLALYTEGVVSAPIEGVARVKIKRNADNSEFLAISFAGPIRGAGGTGQAFTLLLADYCRKKLGIANYRPLDVEVDRYVEEINLYSVRTRAGQYTPSEDEVRHIARNCPVCIDGEPTEDYEVSVNKNVPNVDSNHVRGGMVLVTSEGICLKAAKVAKLYKKLPGIDWSWVEKLIKVAKTEATKSDVKPNDKYLKDIVAGRPIFAYPSRPGAFTLRYGRTRLTGIAAKAIHPATMVILESFPAIGTQVKLERPGKACVITPCEEIDGPLVKLKNGDVLRAKTEQQAHALLPHVEKIIFLGDILINYGDFSKANHPLVPSSWCAEWYAAELAEKGIEKTKQQCEEISFAEALQHCEKGAPLAPRFTLFWPDFSQQEVKKLVEWIAEKGELNEKLVLPLDENKEVLENLGVEHQVQDNKIVIEKEFVDALLFPLGMTELNPDKFLSNYSEEKSVLDILRQTSGVEIVNRAGTYIGASMGRPEKSKERKMQPPVHGLFPVSNYGGKTRSIAKAVKELKNKGERFMQVEVGIRMCPSCKSKTPLSRCSCGRETMLARQCRECGSLCVSEKCPKCKKKASESERQPLDLVTMHEKAAHAVSHAEAKGVIGLISSRKVFEPLEKALLRAKHGVFVFRDGTTRIDATEIPITHFIPAEIGTGIEKLRELGYEKDVDGKPLENAYQVVELKVQDIIINKKSAAYLLNIAKFVDDLLVYLYGLPAFYNAENIDDVVGQLCICIAPHISAGITTRVIGFTEARALLAHPYIHCACRRNCVSGKTLLYYKNDEKTHIEEFEKVFEKYAALSEIKQNLDVETIDLANSVSAFGTDTQGIYQAKEIKKIMRRKYTGEMFKICCENNQEIEVTPDHRLWIFDKHKLIEKKAHELEIGDKMASLAYLEPNKKEQSIERQNDVRIAKVKKIEKTSYSGHVYDIELDDKSEKIFACGKGMLLSHNCDGDELAYMLLLDALINFSKEFLPASRGGQMDAPLVLSSQLNPSEVDDEVHAMDVCSKYPLEFYRASQRNAYPSEVKLETVEKRLGKPGQFEGLRYTHFASLHGPIETAYVTLGDMKEKVKVELDMMKKVRAVDATAAAERIIQSHFFPDLYGNLRSFGRQIFRCVECNSKFRRVPLRGKCSRCGGKLILTINRGGIEKYLELSKKMAEDYSLPLYLKQRLQLIEKDIASLFEDDKSKQFSLAEYL